VYKKPESKFCEAASHLMSGQFREAFLWPLRSNGTAHNNKLFKDDKKRSDMGKEGQKRLSGDVFGRRELSSSSSQMAC
jgi:hypothetical protein